MDKEELFPPLHSLAVFPNNNKNVKGKDTIKAVLDDLYITVTR